MRKSNYNNQSSQRLRRACTPLLCAMFILVVTPGCRSWRESRAAKKPATPPRRTIVTPAPKPTTASSSQRTSSGKASEGSGIRQVVCLFDQRPWLSLDAAGDRDPEGLQFRVFLVDDATRGVLHDGTLHVEMYRLVRGDDGKVERKLSADWHYPSSELTTVRSSMLGDGYNLKLRWAEKDVAGTEVEILASFETPDGKSVRSGTKRLRVPKYSG